MMTQLDFLTHVRTREPEQLSFLDDRLKYHVKRTDKRDINAFFASITAKEIKDHKKVWRDLRCRDISDQFKRWLFAFCSVHTSYESNMRGYLAIKDWGQWINRPDQLKGRLMDSRVGIYNNRTKFISHFTALFWDNPDYFTKHEDESWVECRDRLVEVINGLGKAKVSFALEMLYMETAEVYCMDTHLFQAYGFDQRIHGHKYEECEQHWVSCAKMFQVPSGIARAIYWNRKKNEVNCLYWASVFA
jgi:thermostable 8-oxoguanine DNA glycosylase